MEIRLAQAHEASVICHIAQQAYAPYVDHIGKRPAPMDADYSKHIRDDSTFLAIDTQGHTMGFAVLSTKPSGHWLETLAVAPDSSGKGVGRALVERAELWAKEQGGNVLRLYTNEKMAQNLGWYPRLGYKAYDRRVQAGFARVFFEKSLG